MSHRNSVMLALLMISGCKGGLRGSITVEQFQTLGWLEGRWRGSMGQANPFYESYRFLDDSTLASFSYPDSSFGRAADSSVIELTRGVVLNRGGKSLWRATSLDATSIHFEPVTNAANSFTWRRASPTTWTATLRWRNEQGQEQMRIYQMEKLSP